MLPACAALALAACVSALAPEMTEAEDQAELARLEAEARALASPDGCAQPGDCRSAPVGAKACGGPRSYVVYCAATTDTSHPPLIPSARLGFTAFTVMMLKIV